MDTSTALPRVQTGGISGKRLLYDLLTLSEDQLDVARVRHVGVDLIAEVSMESCSVVYLSRADRGGLNVHGRERGKCVGAA